MPKDIGTLFKPDMVRALLREVNPKRQTRRLHQLGQVGDVLWCREAWRTHEVYDNFPPRSVPVEAHVLYEADGTARPAINGDMVPYGKLRPSMFMCRWMSRLDLPLVEVRQEPLQAISDEDAIKEGILPHRKGGWHWEEPPEGIEGSNHFGFKTPRDAFLVLWECINGVESRNANPTVFVHTFERTK